MGDKCTPYPGAIEGTSGVCESVATPRVFGEGSGHDTSRRRASCERHFSARCGRNISGTRLAPSGRMLRVRAYIAAAALLFVASTAGAEVADVGGSHERAAPQNAPDLLVGVRGGLGGGVNLMGVIGRIE